MNTWNPTLAYPLPEFEKGDKTGRPSNWADCIYYWWYEYLKCNKDYEELCNGSNKRARKKMLEVHEWFKDVHALNFKQWWEQGQLGYEIFHEDDIESFGVVERPSEIDNFPFGHPDVLLLKVPLRTMSKRELKSAFSDLLKLHYTGTTGRRTFEKNSYAQFEVLGRPKIQSLKLHLDIYKFDEANPDVPHWKIFQKFELYNKDNYIYCSVAQPDPDWINMMNSTVSRHLNKARALIHNVGLGRFPDFSSPKKKRL